MLDLKELTPEQEILFLRYYNLTTKQKEDIVDRYKRLGQTMDEISRRFQITLPDVRRVIYPPKNYGNYTAEQKLKHWLAGQKMVKTKKNNREKNKLVSKFVIQ